MSDINGRETEAGTASETTPKTPTLWQVAQSVMYAMIGVQKNKNYERDFTYGKPSQYIFIGLIAVAIFIGVLVTVVKIVMSMAGV